jgi:nicotinic acid mononucleotide adenylyltransferase
VLVRWKPLLEELRHADRPRLVVAPEPGTVPAAVALLAGSFDPLTVAHAAMAEAASRRVDLVVLVYSVRTLPKEAEASPPLLGEEERLAILERFTRERTGLAVGLCSHGLIAEQVDAATSRFPGSELAVVLGSDKLLQLLDHRWYQDRDAVLEPMFSRARVLYALRPGDEHAVEATLREHVRWRAVIERLEVPPHVAAVSSRGVRDRVRRGEDVSGLIPPGFGLDQPGGSS